MASLVSDPSTLTIAQLKKHLKEYNIPIPASDAPKGKLKKADYVRLYRTHLLKDRLECSSDEEGLPDEIERTEVGNTIILLGLLHSWVHWSVEILF